MDLFVVYMLNICKVNAESFVGLFLHCVGVILHDKKHRILNMRTLTNNNKILQRISRQVANPTFS